MNGKKISVLHVMDSDSLGGAQDLLDGILKRYDRTKFRMDLCLLRSEGTKPDFALKKNADKEWVVSKPPLGRLNLLFLPNTPGREHYDILHTHLWTSFVWGSMWFPRLATHLVSSVNHTADQVPFYYFPVYRRLARSKTRYFALNDAIRKDLEKAGIDPARISLQYIGIDDDRFGRSGGREQTMAFFGIKETDRILLRVARLEKDKKHPLFIKAMKLVAAKVPDAKLLIAGEGDQKHELQDLIRRLGLGDNVRILGECRRHLPDLNAIAEIAFSLGWGSACTENMLCGLPVISFDEVAAREVISDGENGLIVPSGDAERFAEAAIGLLSDGDRRKRMGQKARETVLSRFSFTKVISGYEAFYEKLVSGPAGLKDNQ